ncbi:FAD-dependent oxidoreductase [Micrococcus luteus]|uniref:FAD-dependent oxidoreductase n=1 Tax=Micrococcus luteus TaxID=1270 RepID=UPI0033CFFF38
MSDTPAANRRQVAQPETPDTIGAFPRLSDEQIAVLLGRGQRRTLTDGEVLIRPGEHPSSLYVVLEGHLLTADTEPAADPRHPDEPLAVGVHGRGRFVGDVGLLEGQPSFVLVSAIGAAEVVEVPVDELEAIVTSDPLLGEIILRAYLIRRSLAIGAGAGMRIVGSCFSPQTRDLLDFVARNRLPHRLVDLDEDEKAERLVRQLGVAVADFPLVILGGSRTVLGATPARLAEELGMRPPAPPATCDVVVVGAGPAGLAAAVYAASDGLSVYLCDAVATGGQAGTSAKIENYLGFPAGISGFELADRSLLQVRKFGATLDIPTTVQEVVEDEDRFRVIFEDGREVTSDVVVLANGVRYRSLPAAGLDRFQASNVFYAATAQEARMCVDTPVAVVGGGNSAGQAALFLARTSPRVHLVVRAADLGAGMSRYLVDQIQHHPRINVLLSSEVVEAHGGNRSEAVTVRHGDVLEKLRVGHVFVFIGAAPATTGLKVEVARDPDGYILTGAEAELAGARTEGSSRFSLETTIPGVFAIGDVRHGSVKRMTSAVGEGASVVRQIYDYLNEGRHSRVRA